MAERDMALRQLQNIEATGQTTAVQNVEKLQAELTRLAEDREAIIKQRGRRPSRTRPAGISA